MTTMQRLGALARLTFGNPLSLAYLGIVGVLVLLDRTSTASAHSDASIIPGLLALALALPTGAVVFMLRDLFDENVFIPAALVFSYVFQAFVIGVVYRWFRNRAARARTVPGPGAAWENPPHGTDHERR
ncbi:SCO4225 family membrane protein [Streptomyces sp.]|uniref:SCO4225 family membrane protein n=1 Tax=Streptomyces sp. TaxID=1931 RepID=UPI002F934B5E